MSEPLTDAEKEFIREEMQEALAANNQKMMEKVEEKIAAATEDMIKYGDNIALQSDNDKWISAEGGGPDNEGDVFTLTARDENNGPWEAFEIHHGHS
jgi:hypothetical protein